MLNLFNKKEKIIEKTAVQKQAEELTRGFEDKQVKDDYADLIEKNIAIHVMPNKFYVDRVKSNAAKKVGLIVIAGGSIFMVIVFTILYFYLFKDAEPKANSPEQASQENSIQPDSKQIKKDTTPVKNNNKSDNIIPEIKEPVDDVDDDLNLDNDILNLESDAEETNSTSSVISEDLNQDGLIATTTKPVSQEDLDKDGLSSQEEILLGTSNENKDSDQDGYDDLSELLNFYNPAGEGKIVDNSNISEYINATFNYKVLYPNIWTKASIGGDDSVMFKSADNQFIQVIIQPNSEKLTIEEWYKKQFDVDIITEAIAISNANYQGVKNTEGTVVYITDANQEYIYVLSYSSGIERLDYINIFELILQSFTIID